MVLLSISELPATFGSRKGGAPRPGACGAHKARPVPGTAQANAEAENDEVPFFSGACGGLILPQAQPKMSPPQAPETNCT